jgi:hypothetical protein
MPLQKQTTILIQRHLKQTQRVNDNKNDKLKVAKKKIQVTNSNAVITDRDR